MANVFVKNFGVKGGEGACRPYDPWVDSNNADELSSDDEGANDICLSCRFPRFILPPLYLFSVPPSLIVFVMPNSMQSACLIKRCRGL